MGDEGPEFLEGAAVQEKLDPLAGGELALAVQLVDAFLAAPESGLGAALLQLLDPILGAHGHLSIDETMKANLLVGAPGQRRGALTFS